MKIDRKQLKDLILEEMSRIEEEVPAVVQAPTGGNVGQKAAPQDDNVAGGEMPPDVERDLKIGFATKFDELVKSNVNTPQEGAAFLGAMIDLLEKLQPQDIARILRQELNKRQKTV
jgi:hypothetical protein